MRILLVEDDDKKATSIISFLKQTYSDILVDKARSYMSGVDKAMSGTYQMLLLDMTIPNFDGKDNKDSGESLKNGGELIIEELIDEEIDFHCTVITQYETFNDEPLSTIDSRLRALCGEKYHGCIKYDTYNDNWKDLLKANIDNVINTYCR